MQINIQLIEILGIVATILLIISMSFSCKNDKSTIIMRSINALSNILFMIYSVILGAYSVMISNAFILGIDVAYIEKAIKNIRREKRQNG